MTSRDFVYWLNGFFELRDKAGMSLAQVEIVMNHLKMVFIHEIDPSFGGPDEQGKLDAAHKPEPQQGTQSYAETHGGNPGTYAPFNPNKIVMKC